MDKSQIVCLAVVIVISLAAAVGIYVNAMDVGTFSLSDYDASIAFYEATLTPQRIVEQPQYTAKVFTAEKLCIFAYEIWYEWCWNCGYEYIEPYSVDYDAENDAWMISASLIRYDGAGGYGDNTAHTIVNGSDGKLIAMWYDAPAA